MKYKLTINPAVEVSNSSKEFLFEDIDQLKAARDTCASLLLFMQDDIRVMLDYSNAFYAEEKNDDEWSEIDEEWL